MRLFVYTQCNGTRFHAMLMIMFCSSHFRRTSKLTDAPVEYGQIERSHWYQPDWIDEERASAVRDKMLKDGVIYGGSLP